jgi:hypothetical protein
MKKSLFMLLLASTLFASCRLLPFAGLTSTTYIKGKDAFILGNNKHGKFFAKLKNASNTTLTVWKCPIYGGRHSPITVNPNETVKVNVDRDTALKIENDSDVQVAVELVVKGDTGLSMGYKN